MSPDFEIRKWVFPGLLVFKRPHLCLKSALGVNEGGLEGGSGHP
jgi:hypothetical protein